MHADDPQSIEAASRSFKPIHGQVTSSIDSLRIRGNLLVRPTAQYLTHLPACGDTVGAEARHQASREIPSLQQGPELLAGEITKERAREKSPIGQATTRTN